MTQMHRSPNISFAVFLICAGAGCVDMDLQNPNVPDGARALTSENVETLIAGAYDSWLRVHRQAGAACLLSIVAGEHSTPWACCGGEYYSRIPRQPTSNNPGYPYGSRLAYAWYKSYEAIWALRAGLERIEDGVLDVGPGGNLRDRAYGKFVQGLAHGTLALLYDSAYVYDETIATDSVVLQGYRGVMGAALHYLDDAIALAESGTFTIPATWMSQEVSSEALARLAHSWKARLRANVARIPSERGAVNWDAVVADVGAGIGEDWELASQCWPHVFCEEALNLFMRPGWHMQDNWLMGMADVSGRYQAWINTPTIDKQPFIIITPDTRWPQGPDEATQLDNPGDYYVVKRPRLWSRPDRGTWRWSYYDQPKEPYHSFYVNERGNIPQITLREMRALVAEAAYYRGDLAAVASFVNETRTQHGLQATDAAGANADCVPRLPSGACGDLWEMFKWEKRLETQFAGPLRAGWYFDGRGWGDLMEGTVLQFPVPYREMEILQQAAYDYGGVGGEWGAPVGSYGY
jgi:hypothetical protein